MDLDLIIWNYGFNVCNHGYLMLCIALNIHGFNSYKNDIADNMHTCKLKKWNLSRQKYLNTFVQKM